MNHLQVNQTPREVAAASDVIITGIFLELLEI